MNKNIPKYKKKMFVVIFLARENIDSITKNKR